MTAGTRRRGLLRRVLAVAGAALAGTVLLAPPASAHAGPGGSHVPASNYRSRVLRIAPAVPGPEVRTIDAGARFELVNHTGHDVIVLGYQGEPYLRIGTGPPEATAPTGWATRTRPRSTPTPGAPTASRPGRSRCWSGAGR